tara:strand:- start:1585 stop:4149 length:2565 start_codon:yes stop_codon:yes gene_type:complete
MHATISTVFPFTAKCLVDPGFILSYCTSDPKKRTGSAFVGDTKEPMDQSTAFLTFMAEQFPLILPAARKISQRLGLNDNTSPEEGFAEAFTAEVQKALLGQSDDLGETSPFVTAQERLDHACHQMTASIQGYFDREKMKKTLTAEDKRWMLHGMITTRAVDNRMKQLFLSGEIKYNGKGFQGKGFRSLGQEAIYGGALRLHRGSAYASADGWKGDVIGPLIRDMGMALAFTDDDVTMALNAQMGKSGLPLNGKDLHLGDLSRGVFPAAAPLSIASCTVTGVGMGMKLKQEKRVAFSFIGEGGSSLGEWHEAINIAAAQQLPVVFCLQNNQTALSTPTPQQSQVRLFAEKAAGYGMMHVTLDGTDPEALAAGFAWAADRARAGLGPTLIEVVAMRMCGHAHHDDMLYLGADPDLAFDYPEPNQRGYVSTDLYQQWAERDPIKSYAQKLLEESVVTIKEVAQMKATAIARCDEAVKDIADRPWPAGELSGQGVYTSGDETLRHPQPGEALKLKPNLDTNVQLETQPKLHPKGRTFLEGVCQGIGDVLQANDKAFVYGEDVGPPYGNAFMLLRPLVDAFGDRLINAPIAEGGIIGACVGAALEGTLPIGEIQFNDFVASGFNELVNNAAKLHYRTGLKAPFILRMPWGGLRSAGPFHSQDTIPWFYRSFGLKIVVPSTPYDARALMKSAAEDGGPVLFYEHIALYRDPSIKQDLPSDGPAVPIGKAAFRRLGEDLSIISYGAYVHRALACAQRLEEEANITCDVLDLRSLAPLDWDAISQTTLRTGKLLLVGEDSRTGSVLESIASRVNEELYTAMDGPVRVLGALDAPVPYAPSLEKEFLVSNEMLFEHALHLANW